MILSYADKDTLRLAHRERVKRFINIERPALRKLVQLDAAERLNDLTDYH
jgi:proteic killer suppression protein